MLTIVDRMNSAWGESPRTDADRLQVKGRLLSGKEWDNIAEVDEAIAQAALEDWQDSAPVEQFGEILDAEPEGDS